MRPERVGRWMGGRRAHGAQPRHHLEARGARHQHRQHEGALEEPQEDAHPLHLRDRGMHISRAILC